jgi:hypothetical protein
MTGPLQNWLTPAEDTLIARLFARRSRAGAVPPGGFLCGLWSAQSAAGLGPRWQYRMSVVEGDELVVEEKLRLRLRIRDPRPVQPDDPVREGFRAFVAVLVDSGAEILVCAQRRDVYRLLESELVETAGGATPPA